MLLAALPSTPVQLAHACYRIGFEIVIPASWGDELVASAVLEDLRQRNRDPVIQCTCPLVSERLLANGQHLMPSMVQTASPPVAASRYARHALSPRAVHVTYIGACPGARHPAIDERIVPDEFTRMLEEQDIAIADMPTVFDSVLPPDRRRFVSLPGGCPTQEALWQASDGRMLREVTQPTFSTDLAQTLVWREYVMVDVAPSLGCACAGGFSRLGARFGRVAVTALEPPRATQPVVSYQPEFTTAIVEEPTFPTRRNGDTPSEQPTEASEAAQSESLLADAASDASVTSKVRVRSPASAPLPRAYLAKRRHLASGTKDSVVQAEAQPPESTKHEREAVVESTPVHNEYAEAVETAPSPLPNEDVLQQRLQLDDFPSWPAEPTYVPVAAEEHGDVPVADDEPAETPPAYAPPPQPPVASAEPARAPVAGPEAADTTLDYAPPSHPPTPSAQPAEVPVASAVAAYSTFAYAPPPEPMASAEPAEVPLSIAVHFEPEATAGAEQSVVQSPYLEVDVTTQVAPSPPNEGAETSPVPLRQTFEAREAEEWVPSVAVAFEEERDDFAPANGPLRVEVEIYEETAAVVAAPDVAATQVIVNEEPIELADAAEATPQEPAAQPGSAWGDLLIALWLVLVASAVIASLIWRR